MMSALPVGEPIEAPELAPAPSASLAPAGPWATRAPSLEYTPVVAGAAWPSAAQRSSRQEHTRHLVVDSGAIIKGLHLQDHADFFWTVPEVLKEIRDKRARHVLETLPYELRTRQPSGEAVQAVIDFARKTGDYTQLSVPDLKVLALTYMIEREQNGLSNIRVEPPLRAAEQAAAKAAKAKAAAAAKAGSAAAAGANANPGMSKKAAARAARLSRTLAWILRHGADDLELGADAQGFVAVEKLLEVEQLRTRKPRTTAQHIRDAVHHAGSAGMFTLVRVAIKSPSTAAESAAEGATTEEATPAAGGAGVGAAPPLPPTSAPKPARAFGARRKKTAVATRLMIRATGGHTLAAVVAAAPAAAAAAAAAAPSAEAPTGSAPVVAAAAAASAARRASKDAAASAAPVAAAAAAAATTKKKKNTLTSRIFGADGSMGQSTVLESAADDEDGDWVNPGNFDGVSIGVGVGGSTGSSMFAGSAACALTTVKAERGAGASGSGAAGAPPRVGCITTDFAMQNVILQMNLKLVALNGSVITRCKQWLLRCDACFFIVKPDANAALTGDRHRSAAAQNQALADSLFCPKCGSAALNRVAYSTDATGRTKLHLRKNRRIATKGMQYSIPKHHGGRAPDQLLRADQLLTGAWKQRASTRQTARSAFGSHITGELGMSVGTVPAEVKVGFGRNNPNAQRGRERRGKKKVSNGVTNRHNKKAGEKHLRFY